MSDRERCAEIRRIACDWRAGRLSDHEAARCAEHLACCPGCSDHVGRLGDMLGALSDDARAPAPFDADALFDRIMGEVDGAQTPPREEAAAEAITDSEDRDDGYDEVGSPLRALWPWAVAALAAAILLALLAPSLRRDEAPLGPAEAPPIADLERGEDQLEGELRPAQLAEAPVLPPARVELAELTASPTPHDAIRVFASPGARWSLTEARAGEGLEAHIDLQDGVILVEFLPGEVRSLVVATDDLEARVVGTVFYAAERHDDDVVGVVTGAVDVEVRSSDRPAETNAVRLSDGERFERGAGRGAEDKATTREAARWIDIASHRTQLAAASTSTEAATKDEAPRPRRRPSAPTPPAEESKEETPTEDPHTISQRRIVADLRAQASLALRERRYLDASGILERLLVELPSAHPEAASARLDLARIYLRHLDRSERAARHLKRFILDRPDDPATPSAREEYCRVVAEAGHDDGLCEDP